ncbi:hypothetical protein, partial [Aeromonas veronii]|uniref:hypothetical protein n=1 Tax=Aeromonas veronii TaxID=654 RepID=UPI00406C0429
LTVQQFNNVIGAYTFQGDQILIKPVVPTGSTVKFLYITDNIVKSKDGVRKKVFTDDTDVFRLDERVLELGIVWQWKANKGL